MENTNEDYKQLDYYVNLSDYNKMRFDKFYLKYEGNRFKAQKALEMDKKVSKISLVLGILIFILVLFAKGEFAPILIVFLVFLEGVVSSYGFIYKLSGTNVLLSIILSLIIGAILAVIIGYIITAIFWSYALSNI